MYPMSMSVRPLLPSPWGPDLPAVSHVSLLAGRLGLSVVSTPGALCLSLAPSGCQPGAQPGEGCGWVGHERTLASPCRPSFPPTPPSTVEDFPLEGAQPVFYLAAGGDLIKNLKFGQVILFPTAPKSAKTNSFNSSSLGGWGSCPAREARTGGQAFFLP